MGKNQTKTKAAQIKKKVTFSCVIFGILLFGFLSLCVISEKFKWDYIPSFTQVKEFLGVIPKQVESDCAVHFIDVGQGDSIFIQSDGKNILIDAGENNQGTKVVRYLKNYNVEVIDLLIGTHPHSDHIGGMDTVINNFEIKQIIMPKLANHLVPTTKTYTEVLEAVQQKQLKITPAKIGNSYDFGKGKLTIVGPSENYDDLNNASVVVYFAYDKDESFLFTGDMESSGEKELLKNNIDIEADILKVGHHGSKSSTTQEFLMKTSPCYAVISVGEDNRYNHPHQVTLDKLNQSDVSVYRTDYDGNIIFYIIQGELEIRTEK